jgi:hypothetical protein
MEHNIHAHTRRVRTVLQKQHWGSLLLLFQLCIWHVRLVQQRVVHQFGLLHLLLHRERQRHEGLAIQRGRGDARYRGLHLAHGVDATQLQERTGRHDPDLATGVGHLPRLELGFDAGGQAGGVILACSAEREAYGQVTVGVRIQQL